MEAVAIAARSGSCRELNARVAKDHEVLASCCGVNEPKLGSAAADRDESSGPWRMDSTAYAHKVFESSCSPKR